MMYHGIRNLCRLICYFRTDHYTLEYILIIMLINNNVYLDCFSHYSVWVLENDIENYRQLNLEIGCNATSRMIKNINFNDFKYYKISII